MVPEGEGEEGEKPQTRIKTDRALRGHTAFVTSKNNYTYGGFTFNASGPRKIGVSPPSPPPFLQTRKLSMGGGRGLI